jgi:hypothetical protein
VLAALDRGRPHVGIGEDEATFVARHSSGAAGSSSIAKMAGRRWGERR